MDTRAFDEEPNPGRKLLAWGIHGYTGLGLPLAFLCGSITMSMPMPSHSNCSAMAAPTTRSPCSSSEPESGRRSWRTDRSWADRIMRPARSVSVAIQASHHPQPTGETASRSPRLPRDGAR